eukprot:m.135439 g.135439  ORF g.135439 m.135439 type:complete len:171 (+) comp15847_c1_seq2:303-815(+)
MSNLDFDDPERYKVGDETFARDIDPLRIVRGEDKYSATFIIANEDHTLGNSLRWMLNKDPRVDFCGYSQPHPSDKLIKLRVQAKRPKDEDEDAVDATDLLRDALANLVEMCDFMTETVEAQARTYREAHNMEIPPYQLEDVNGDMEEDADEEEDEEEDEDEEAAEEEADE